MINALQDIDLTSFATFLSISGLYLYGNIKLAPSHVVIAMAFCSRINSSLGFHVSQAIQILINSRISLNRIEVSEFFVKDIHIHIYKMNLFLFKEFLNTEENQMSRVQGNLRNHVKISENDQVSIRVSAMNAELSYGELPSKSCLNCFQTTKNNVNIVFYINNKILNYFILFLIERK